MIEIRCLVTLDWSGMAGYGDNLALADRALGEIRAPMEAAGTWDTSGLVITSDHAWRDAARPDGGRDPRVPLLIRMPGQTRHLGLNDPVETIVVHGVAIGILRGTITTPEQALAVLSGGTDQY